MRDRTAVRKSYGWTASQGWSCLFGDSTVTCTLAATGPAEHQPRRCL